MQSKGIFVKKHSFFRIVPLPTVTPIFPVIQSLTLAHITTENFFALCQTSYFSKIVKAEETFNYLHSKSA